MNKVKAKILGRKAYGSIGHLPNSRMGAGDHAVPPGQAAICTKKPRKGDTIICQEKLDGSCVAVALIDGQLHPLGRAGWPAVSSPYLQHRMFHDWAMLNSERFFGVLREGERVVGEWLAQAHGTRYMLTDLEPFVPFDIMHEAFAVNDRGEQYAYQRRLPFVEFNRRVDELFRTPPLLHFGDTAISVEKAMQSAGKYGLYGAFDEIEGVVYRVETGGEVDFMAKYVRPDKVDGYFLPEVSNGEPVWNWHP